MKKIRIEVVVTNGDKLCRLAWLENLKGKGIYGGFWPSPGNLHFSYHLDGAVHTKIDTKTDKNIQGDNFHNDKGYASFGLNGPPLNDFKGYFSLLQGGFTLENDNLKDITAYNFKKADRLILLDSRSITKKPKTLSVYFDIVEANNYKVLSKRIQKMHDFIISDSKSICEHHCYLEQSPWIIVHLAYQSKRHH